MLTKDQERKALEKVKKILAELGTDKENSYVLTAFDGCVEDAETNIEHDFALSAKYRAESARKQLEETKTELEYWKEKAEKAAALNRKILSHKDAATIQNIIQNDLSRQKEEEKESGKLIIEYAEKPDSDTFIKSVNRNRAARKIIEIDERLIKTLENSYFTLDLKN